MQNNTENANVANVANNEPIIFNWKLESNVYKTSIFDKKKMIEYVDIKKVYGFIKANMGISYSGIRRYENLPFEDELAWMKEYKTQFDKHAKIIKTAHSLPKHKWGRVYQYLSLSVAHRPTRHSLCYGEYVDIDMINAHPNIINSVCIMNGVPLIYLHRYTEERDEILNLIMNHYGVNRDVAKNLPIVLMFGGTYNGWLKENGITINEKLEEIEGLERDMKVVIDIVYDRNKHIEASVLKQEPTKWRTLDDKKRGVMGLWGQSVERLLQEGAISYLVNKYDMPIEEIIPCQDGFMVRERYFKNSMIDDINELMINNFGFDVQFKVKEFNERFDIIPYDNEKSIEEWNDLLSTKQLADRFIQEFNDIICYKNGILYIYYGKTDITDESVNGRAFQKRKREMKNARWYQESRDTPHLINLISENLHSIIAEELANAVELTEKEFSDFYKLLRSNTSGYRFKEVKMHVLPLVRENTEEFDEKPFLLGFENGVYDLMNKEFREYRYDDYVTMSTGYDYKSVNYGENTNDNDDEIMENRRLKNELIEIIESIHPDPNERIFFLQILASGLDGLLYQKIHLFNGAGGNGKGLIQSLMNKILGGYFVSPNNGILREFEKSNAPSPDMLALKNKRYINFKEVNGNIKSSVVRNLTGGGMFSGRMLNQNPETFTMKGTFVFEFNNAPDLEGKPMESDYRRMVHIHFPVNFTENPDKIGKTIGGIQYKRANLHYTSAEFVEKMKYVFLNFLLETYSLYQNKRNPLIGINFDVPEAVYRRSEVFVSNQNLFNRVIFDNYEKVDVDIEQNKMKIKDLWLFFESSPEYRGLNTRERREYGRKECYEWLNENFDIRTEAGRYQYVYGIRRKIIFDDNVPIETNENLFY